MRKSVRHPRDPGWKPVFGVLLLISMAAVGTNLWLARRALSPAEFSYSAPDLRRSSTSGSAPDQVKQGADGTYDAPVVLTTGPFNCSVVDQLLGDMSLPDPVAWRGLARLCSSSLRPRVSMSVVPAYRQRYLEMTNGTGIIPEAFVSFVRLAKYAHLMHASLAATSEFTDRPTVLLVTNSIDVPIETMWPPEQYKNLIVFQRDDPAGAPLDYWFDKLYIIAMSPVLRGCLIESDTIINPNADHVFDILRRHGNQQFPLLATHADERLQNCTGYKGSKICTNTYVYVRERSMPYMHSNHIGWTVHSKRFVADVLADCSRATLYPGTRNVFLSPNLVLCINDEDAMNWSLWNADAKVQRCLDDPSPGEEAAHQQALHEAMAMCSEGGTDAGCPA